MTFQNGYDILLLGNSTCILFYIIKRRILAVMKTVFKIISGIILSIIGIAALNVILLIFAFTADTSREKTVVTEYGDEFTVSTFTGLANGACTISEKGHTITSFGWYNTEIEIEGLCDTPQFRCYKVSNTVFFRKADGEKFEALDWDLFTDNEYDDRIYSHKDAVSAAKSILLKDELILKRYLPYFLEAYPEETEKMLADLADVNYTELSEYGLTPDIISNEEKLKKIISIADQYLP